VATKPAPRPHAVADLHGSNGSNNNNNAARLQQEVNVSIHFFSPCDPYRFSFDQINELQELLHQHEQQIAGLEKERDFYYQKLRDVEMVCQEPEHESFPSVQRILEVLYATEVSH
jgi:microtubule-associated protein, RP/EB family